MPPDPLADTRLSPHFLLNEFRCHCGVCPWPPAPEIVAALRVLAAKLELLRTQFGQPIHINSGYRCPAYNARVGGVGNSQHTTGRAADCVPRNIPLREYAKAAYAAGFGGVGLYTSFVHCDTRPRPAGARPARWTGANVQPPEWWIV